MRRPSTAAFYSRPLSRAKSTATSNTAPATPALALGENTSPAKSPPPVPSVKEARAWEHDRQRLKKTAAFVKSKARKAQHGQAQAHGGWSTAKLYDRHSHSAAARALMDDDGDEPVCGESEVDWDDAASPLRSPRVELGREGTEHAPSRAEVPLADLLISRKPRHGRESGFEVVPPIRSVIVLDDAIAPDLDFDEPWEHVSADDADEHEPEPSYAKIAALN